MVVEVVLEWIVFVVVLKCGLDYMYLFKLVLVNLILWFKLFCWDWNCCDYSLSVIN